MNKYLSSVVIITLLVTFLPACNNASGETEEAKNQQVQAAPAPEAAKPDVPLTAISTAATATATLEPLKQPHEKPAASATETPKPEETIHEPHKAGSQVSATPIVQPSPGK